MSFSEGLYSLLSQKKLDELLLKSYKDKDVKKFSLLLDAGANPDTQTKYDKSILSHALYTFRTECIILLLEAGADPNLQDKYGNTVLMEASRWGYTESVILLLQAGANPDLQDKYGNTALMNALRYGYIECVKVLLEAGANPDLQDNYGRTVLMLASFNGYTEYVRLLIQFKANPLLVDKDGRSALEYSNSKIKKIISEYIKKITLPILYKTNIPKAVVDEHIMKFLVKENKFSKRKQKKQKK